MGWASRSELAISSREASYDVCFLQEMAFSCDLYTNPECGLGLSDFKNSNMLSVRSTVSIVPDYDSGT